MKKTGIIIKREYLRRVYKKSFIFLTLFAPLLFAALVFVPLWLSSIKDDGVREILVLDKTGKYGELFQNTDNFRFVNTKNPEPVDKSKENNQGMFAFMEITEDLLLNPRAVTIYSEKQIPVDLKNEISRTLNEFLTKEKIESYKIPDLEKIISESRIRVDVQTYKWSKDGTASESSSLISSTTGMVFTIIIFMFIMMYGGMVMQGVMEEKTNRIVEVMVSSVKPFDLMMGKIIGIGLVGITQMVIWGVLTSVLISAGGIFFGLRGAGHEAMAMQPMMSNPEALSQVSSLLLKLNSINFVQIIVCFVLYFIGGYILYASIFAAIGAVVDNPEDSQQFMTPMMVILMFAFYAGLYSANNPDGPLAFWCSLFPFTSSIVMMVRIPYEIPLWQIVVSLVLLFVSAILLVWFSAKIYRVGILMYGKKPSLKEIVRWMKY
jgi:ABC-2 type transport system permease protein